jgi:hypothetical protein
MDRLFRWHEREKRSTFSHSTSVSYVITHMIDLGILLNIVVWSALDKRGFTGIIARWQI